MSSWLYGKGSHKLHTLTLQNIYRLWLSADWSLVSPKLHTRLFGERSSFTQFTKSSTPPCLRIIIDWSSWHQWRGPWWIDVNLRLCGWGFYWRCLFVGIFIGLSCVFCPDFDWWYTSIFTYRHIVIESPTVSLYDDNNSHGRHRGFTKSMLFFEIIIAKLYVSS